MIVRLAELEDVSTVCTLAVEWLEEMGYDVRPERLSAECVDILRTGRMFLAYDGDALAGFMGAKIIEPIWNGHKTAHEHYVFVAPGSRSGKAFSLLRQTFEEWARMMGCADVAFHPSAFGSRRAETLCHHLIRKGYALTGYEVTKELNHV